MEQPTAVNIETGTTGCEAGRDALARAWATRFGSRTTMRISGTCSLVFLVLLVWAVPLRTHAQAPALSIVSRGGGWFVLSWPGTASDYELEAVDDFAGELVWGPVADRATLVNNEFQVSIAATNSARFFRLRSTTVTGVPPDPATLAPPLSPSRVGDLASATAFLYTGANAIQTGVVAGTLEARRVCVLRGRVTKRDGSGLPGVTIAILNHPEFGRTRTRADGMFDLAANGGGLLTVSYDSPGYIPIHRQTQTPWNDYAFVPDAVMTTLDSVVNPVAMGTNSPIQVARGSVVTDADGSRTATLIIPAGTGAKLIINGATQSCSSLHIRATEFTVGISGPSAMPAPLPASSRYTYCVELSADEAADTHATSIQFTKPLWFYVENFLKFGVGEIVPTGFYDRQKGIWVASQNGRVIKILSVSGGVATLDTDGDGLADTPAQLAAMGITDDERQRLAALYPAGQTLWRTCVEHFSPWDCNDPGGPPRLAQSPANSPRNKNDPNDPCKGLSSSVIYTESQAFGEDVSIAGTPYHLHYQSDRAAGDKELYTVRIPLSDATIPPGLKRIVLNVEVVGRVFKQEFSPTPGQSTSFTWDGLDAYGRFVPGTQPISVKIGYVYNEVYYPPSQFDQAFAAFADDIVTASPARGEITLWKYWRGLVGNLLSGSLGLGGWTLNVNHSYDSRAKTLYSGDGGRRGAAGMDTTVITTFAGGGFVPGIGDGGRAVAAELSVPSGLAVGPDGSLYIAEAVGQRVRRVTPDGIIATIAGSTNGQSCLTATNACGDGGPALQALLNSPEGVAVAQDGTVYIADRADNRIRKVDTSGSITTVAGTGEFGYSGDGGPAVQAKLTEPYGVTVGPDGSLYIADTGNGRIRRVGGDGVITTVAGAGFVPGAGLGDGGPASKAQLQQPWRVAFDLDGNMFIVDRGHHRIRRVGVDGVITTVAGSGSSGGYSGDGGAAILAQLNLPQDIAVAPDGSFFIADRSNARVRLVGTEGTITTFAGNGQFGYSGEGGPATQAKLSEPVALALGPDGSLYESDWFNQRVRRISSAFPGSSLNEVLITSDDGTEVYVFDNGGQHLRTLDAFTQALLYQFSYDPQGRLLTITDVDNNVTTVQHQASGNPSGILGPYGQLTLLTADANGYLASVTNPANEEWAFSYAAGGLLTSVTKPRGNTWNLAYDNLGRLTSDIDPAGGAKLLTRTETNDSYTVSLGTLLERTNRYEVTSLPSGGRRRIHEFPSGLQTERLDGADGTLTYQSPDGMATTVVLGPDPRWGMLAPVASVLTTITPGGLTNVISTQRTVKLASPDDPFSLVSFSESNDFNGRKFNSTYTAATQTTVTTTPAGRQTVTKYDSLMRPVQEQIGDLAPIGYTYDSRGRVTATVWGTGGRARTNHFGYDPGGYFTSLVDPLGRSLTIGYDAAGRTNRLTFSDNRTIGYDYDSDGNLTRVTPPGKPAHALSYSPVDLQTLYVPPTVVPGTNSTEYSYNSDRQLILVTRPDAQTVRYDYTAGGCNCDRLSLVAQPRGTNYYTYDPVTGNLAGVSTPDGVTLTFSYDGNLLTKESWSGSVGGSVTYGYDNDFRPTNSVVNGTSSITFQYDVDGFLIQAGAMSLTRGSKNGLIASTTLGQVTNVWGYNEFAEPTNSSAYFGANPLYAAQYTRDAAGRITRKTETIAGVTSRFDYSYDMGGRLASVAKDGVTSVTYTYDSNDNRISATDSAGTQTGACDDQDRLIQYGATSCSYSANGELQTKSVAGQTTAYEYDLLGNLTRVTPPGGVRIDYLIDGLDRRVGKQVNGSLSQAFVYDNQSRLVAELDSAGKVVSRFVYGTDRNSPDYIIKNDFVYSIVSDQVGSPRLIVDVKTGVIAQRIDYDEFGRVLTDTAPGFQPFGFAGGLYDRDAMLVRFGARDYDPETGRWTAKDPIGFGGGDANLYAYAGDDPVNHTDPSGLQQTPQRVKPPSPGGEYTKLHKGLGLNDPCKAPKAAFDFSHPLQSLFNMVADALSGS